MQRPPRVACCTLCPNVQQCTMQNDALMGSKEACRLLDIDKSTLSRWVAAGKLTPVTQLPGINGAFLFNRVDVEALLSEPTQAAS